MSTLPTVIITGASRGIGRGIAIDLAKSGKYKLCLLSRNVNGLSETKRLAQKENSNAMIKCIKCDLSDMDGLKSILIDICENYGPLHVLINNAGAGGSGNAFNANLKHWDFMLDVNLRSLIHSSAICLPYLKQAKSRNNDDNVAIINIGSISGTMGGLEPNSSIYISTKFGVLGFTESVFEDARESGIKVSCIMPAFVDTEMVRKIYSPKQLNFSRMIKISDIAKSVQFILDCSTAACPTQIVIREQQTPIRAKM